MNSRLKPKSYYENLYDKFTVERGRSNQARFEDFYKEWFKIMPDEKPDSFRSVFHLNWVYMLFAGNELIDRYDAREEKIAAMMRRDEITDEQLAAARLISEPECTHCGAKGLRITSKDLMNRGDDHSHDAPEEVLFTLKCPSCQKNSAYWADGTVWEIRETKCPKCGNGMQSKSTIKNKLYTTSYSCAGCGQKYKDTYDYSEKDDPDFETDANAYCLRDEEVLQEFRDAKARFEGLAQLGKELKDKEDHKDLYAALAIIKKLKIAELSPLLAPALEKANFIELSLDKPDLGRSVTINFSCLDNKSDRDDDQSSKILKKTISKALFNTNWRLMSEGISYRLGYLSGRLRAYEQDEEILKIITKK